MGKRITNLITLIFTYTLSVSFRVNIECSKLIKMKNNWFSLERAPVGTNYNQPAGFFSKALCVSSFVFVSQIRIYQAYYCLLLRFTFIVFDEVDEVNFIKQQESFPVECVPQALVATTRRQYQGSGIGVLGYWGWQVSRGQLLPHYQTLNPVGQND